MKRVDVAFAVAVLAVVAVGLAVMAFLRLDNPGADTCGTTTATPAEANDEEERFICLNRSR